MEEREMYPFERDWLERYPYRLSRKFEDNLPEFSSHFEARDYFKKKYGDDFIYEQSIEDLSEELGTVYIYRLIVDSETYRKSEQYSFKTQGIPIADSLSYHPVEIFDGGGIHIVF